MVQMCHMRVCVPARHGPHHLGFDRPDPPPCKHLTWPAEFSVNEHCGRGGRSVILLHFSLVRTRGPWTSLNKLWQAAHLSRRLLYYYYR